LVIVVGALRSAQALLEPDRRRVREALLGADADSTAAEEGETDSTLTTVPEVANAPTVADGLLKNVGESLVGNVPGNVIGSMIGSANGSVNVSVAGYLSGSAGNWFGFQSITWRLLI
jgi:hypothetical protein